MKVYLGDSVYGEWDDNGNLVLTTNNGEGPTNTIILEEDVIAQLLSFVAGSK